MGTSTVFDEIMVIFSSNGFIIPFSYILGTGFAIQSLGLSDSLE